MEQNIPPRIGLEETLRSLSLSSDTPRLPARGSRYTWFIRLMRVVLPFLAAAMIVVIFTWEESGKKISAVSKEDILPAQGPVQNELIDPVFSSRDEEGQPYEIKALRAVQDKVNQNQVLLDAPHAMLDTNDGEKLEAKAQQALYEQDQKKLNLRGDVTLTYSQGYALSTEELRVDLETQKAYSGRTVRLEGEAGSLDAAGMEGDVSSGVVIFNGPARILLHEGEGAAPQKERARASQETSTGEGKTP